MALALAGRPSTPGGTSLVGRFCPARTTLIRAGERPPTQAWARNDRQRPEDMAAKWHTLGFVVEQGGQFVEGSERCDTSFIQLLTPNLVFQDVPHGPDGHGRARRRSPCPSRSCPPAVVRCVTLEVLSGNGAEPPPPHTSRDSDGSPWDPLVWQRSGDDRRDYWVILRGPGAVGEVRERPADGQPPSPAG
jgi:hypothetical protein